MSNVKGGIPTCAYCRRSAEEIAEYVDAARDENLDLGTRTTPTEWMMREEGTYNPITNHFCCTACYIRVGLPVGVGGRRWIAP